MQVATQKVIRLFTNKDKPKFQFVKTGKYYIDYLLLSLVPFTHKHLDMYWLVRGSMKACGFILFLSCSFKRKMAFKKENTYIRKLFWKFIPLERNKM